MKLFPAAALVRWGMGAVSLLAIAACSPWRIHTDAERQADALAVAGRLAEAAAVMQRAAREDRVGSVWHSSSLIAAARYLAADGRVAQANQALDECIRTAKDAWWAGSCRRTKRDLAVGRLPQRDRLIESARESIEIHRKLARESATGSHIVMPVPQPVLAPPVTGALSRSPEGGVTPAGPNDSLRTLSVTTSAYVGGENMHCVVSVRAPSINYLNHDVRIFTLYPLDKISYGQTIDGVVKAGLLAEKDSIQRTLSEWMDANRPTVEHACRSSFAHLRPQPGSKYGMLGPRIPLGTMVVR